jgi:hypothetical protein
MVTLKANLEVRFGMSRVTKTEVFSNSIPGDIIEVSKELKARANDFVFTNLRTGETTRKTAYQFKEFCRSMENIFGMPVIVPVEAKGIDEDVELEEVETEETVENTEE